MTEPTQSQKKFHLLNKCFLALNTCLSILLLILSLAFSSNLCLSLTCLIYETLYIFQSAQHYLIYKFPLIDINKHHVLYRRIVILICLVDMAYMLMGITFWQKSQYHPVYCFLCLERGVGMWVGLGFVGHQVVLIGWAITLINAYVTRRYYLLALGGFETEQRIIQQRQRQLRQMMIIEPDLNPYPIINAPKDKYYKFEDVTDIEEDSTICSICLNKRVDDDHFVNAGCGHYFHNVCLIQWAQVNQNCPQCRRKFKQQPQPIQQQQQQYEQQPNQQQNTQQPQPTVPHPHPAPDSVSLQINNNQAKHDK